jgi:hypothetical protein
MLPPVHFFVYSFARCFRNLASNFAGGWKDLATESDTLKCPVFAKKESLSCMQEVIHHCFAPSSQ